MNNEINIKADYLTFRNQVKGKLGDDFAEQAYLFFERAVLEAKKNLEHSAIADAEYALALAQHAKDDFPVLYIIGFLCEVHIFTDQIKKAKFYYNLGLELLDKNSVDYDDNDKASFDRLQDLMQGEYWKEKHDDNEVIDEGDDAYNGGLNQFLNLKKTIDKHITKENSKFYASQVDKFFVKAANLAIQKKFHKAIELGNNAFILAKYANIGYSVLYIVGMLCEAYLDIDQPEIANDFYNYGMKIIDKSDDNYERDLKLFHYLKMDIDEELKNKNGL